MKKALTILFALAAFNLCAILLQACCRDVKTICTNVSSVTIIPLNNSFAEPQPVNNNEVHGAALLLRASFANEIGMCFIPSLTTITTAYATSCREDNYVDLIVDYDIISDRDFDGTHKAGASLKDVFRLKGYLEEIAKHEQYNIDLLALRPPADSGTHAFTVKFLSKSGREMVATAGPIKLLK